MGEVITLTDEPVEALRQLVGTLDPVGKEGTIVLIVADANFPESDIKRYTIGRRYIPIINLMLDHAKKGVLEDD